VTSDSTLWLEHRAREAAPLHHHTNLFSEEVMIAAASRVLESTKFQWASFASDPEGEQGGEHLDYVGRAFGALSTTQAFADLDKDLREQVKSVLKECDADMHSLLKPWWGDTAPMAVAFLQGPDSEGAAVDLRSSHAVGRPS
jgi:hypothetical protein